MQYSTGIDEFIRKKTVQFYVLVDTINAVDTNHPTSVDYRFQMLGFRELAGLVSIYLTEEPSGVAYGENSPNLCPTMSSVMTTGT